MCQEARSRCRLPPETHSLSSRLREECRCVYCKLKDTGSKAHLNPEEIHRGRKRQFCCQDSVRSSLRERTASYVGGEAREELPALIILCLCSTHPSQRLLH